MRIDQFVHTLNYGDAISNEAITLKNMFDAKGIESRIFSVHAHEKVKNQVCSWVDAKSAIDNACVDGKSAIILHYSIGSPLNALFAKLQSVKKVLVYHNLTPVHWFSSYNYRVANDLENGMKELPELASKADLLIADSTFNKTELEGFGGRNVRVLPLALDTQKWSVTSNAGIAAALKGHGGKNILHVGRIAPNKKIEDIIKAFYFYHHKIERKSKLWLVGIDIDTEIYSFELRRMVTEFRLEHAVEFVGAVADCELKAFYENSDAYVCMSEHEGFCAPLLEAMHFSLPVIAFDSCAVAETLGNGGLLLSQKSPAAVAELINLVITDFALKTEIIENGKLRAREFELARFSSRVESELVNPLWSAK